MTDQTAQEPTMEEILASIRRIISEDDAPAETAPVAAAPEPQPAPEPEPVHSSALMDETPSMEEPHASEEDVLELTDAYEAPGAESLGDLDIPPHGPFPSAPCDDFWFVNGPSASPFPLKPWAAPPRPSTNWPARCCGRC